MLKGAFLALVERDPMIRIQSIGQAKRGAADRQTTEWLVDMAGPEFSVEFGGLVPGPVFCTVQPR